MARCGTFSGIPLETFSKVVETISDCALNPSCWPQVLSSITKLSRSHFGLLALIDLENEHCELACHVGYRPQFQKLFEEKYAASSPYISRLKGLPLATVATRAMLIDEPDLSKCPWYEEFVEPQEICDAIGFTILKTRQRVALLAFHRHKSEGRYQYEDLRLLSLLAPHVSRSMAIADTLSVRNIRSLALEKTLESLAFGVYLVDCNGHLVFMNRAADRQVRTSDAVRIADTRLAPIDCSARAALTEAIARAAAKEGETPSSDVAMIALPGEENTGLVATVLPLNSREHHNFFCGSMPAAAIFVQDPLAEAPTSGEGFAKLYGLTHGELRVLLVMLPGLAVKDAADMLGISEATAKTHLQHIHAKTGISKQTELMRLFSGSTPPIDVAQQSSPTLAVPELASAGRNRLICRDPDKRLRSGALLATSTLAEMACEIPLCCLLPMSL